MAEFLAGQSGTPDGGVAGNDAGCGIPAARLESARAVCRLTAVFDGNVYYGTGFRIGPRTLLTNHHVLHDWEHYDALPFSVIADFGYELDVHGKLRIPTTVSCDVATIAAKHDHDFAVIEAADDIPEDITVLALDPGAGSSGR